VIASGSAVAGNEEVDGCQERRVLFEAEVVDNVDHADGSEMRKRERVLRCAPHLGLSIKWLDKWGNLSSDEVRT